VATGGEEARRQGEERRQGEKETRRRGERRQGEKETRRRGERREETRRQGEEERSVSNIMCDEVHVLLRAGKQKQDLWSSGPHVDPIKSTSPFRTTKALKQLEPLMIRSCMWTLESTCRTVSRGAVWT